MMPHSTRRTNGSAPASQAEDARNGTYGAVRSSLRIHLRKAAMGIALLLLPVGASEAQDGRYAAARHGGMYMTNYYLPPAPSSSPWAPSWRPDGERITVSMSGSLWNVDPGSETAEEIVQGDFYASQPEWSPDGKQLVYTADDGLQTIHLRLRNLETGKDTALTEGPSINVEPRFSPDGQRLAWVTTQPTGYFNIAVADVGTNGFTGDPTFITYDNQFEADGEPRERLYFGSWDMHLSPSWFPDGKELLLLSNRNVALGSGNVVRVAAHAKGIDEAQTVLAEQTLYRTRPDVSPDGTRFIYSSTAGAADEFNNLYVQPTQGGVPYKVTHYRHDAFHPRWSPDGERVAYVSNESGLPQLEILEIHGGRRTRVAVDLKRWSRPAGRLRIETLDGRDGPQTATRIELVASDGKVHTPSDAYARISRAGDRVFHQPGVFEMELPAGPVTIQASKGFEYSPQDLRLEVTDGETSEATIIMTRIANPAQSGWFSGSTHVHMNYGGNLRNTLENLKLMSRAEGQHLLTEQIANKDNRILDLDIFEPGGGPHSTSDADLPVLVGQEYRPPFYGHVFMFGMRDHLISPFATGYEGTAIESLYPSNTDMLRKASEQGAVVGYVHSFYFGDPLETNLGGAKGFLVDAALGSTDALEWSMAQDGFPPLYAAWGNGLKVTAVGGEDSISDLHYSSMVGSMRTYVRTADRTLTVRGWLDGLVAGTAWVSNGPLLNVTVESADPGGLVRLGSPGKVKLQASVRSITPLDKLHIVVGGAPYETIHFTGDRKLLTVERELDIDRSTWVHVRAEGKPEDRYPLDAGYGQAFTNPVWIEVANRPVRDRAAANYALRWIDKLQGMAEVHPGWRSQAEKDHVMDQFEEAREVYLKRRVEAPE